MPKQEFEANLKAFRTLIEQFANHPDEHMNSLIKQYIEQNIVVLNDVLATSIDNLHRLQKAKSSNDIICTQARLTNELSKKLSLSAQRFLNASLGHISDYNEWLAAHCDFATD